MKIESMYGVTIFKGEKYDVICAAWIDSEYDTNAVWHAYAMREGKKYIVTWYTSKEWDKCSELHKLEEQLEQLKQLRNPHYTNAGEEMIIEQIMRDIKKLEHKGYSTLFIEDAAAACDWDNADGVYEIDLDVE